MDPNTARKLYRRAIFSARAYGFGDFATDIAQEVLKKFAAGRGKSQTVDQAVVDVIRSMFGRPKSVNHEVKLALENARELTPALGNQVLRVDPREEIDTRIDFERLSKALRFDERVILRLWIDWGLNQEEIGEVIGVTHSRISQKLRDIFMQARIYYSPGGDIELKKKKHKGKKKKGMEH